MEKLFHQISSYLYLSLPFPIFEDNQKDSLNEETTFTDKTDHNSESKSFDERLMKNYFENQSEKDYY